MASADYSVGTKVTADVSNFEKGMNKAEKSLKGFSNKLADNINRLGKKGLVGSLGSVGLALGGITSAVGIATKAIKKVSQAIGECTEAFRKQNKAEIALETAVKNNPYIDGSSINGLKQFAGEMQRVSEIGDEQFLPMMAQLIATGRTEAETMDIIRVATDMSATGTMSFETAVQQLNATLNGNIGRLGQQNSELKNLTEEELKSGKAVEILGNKFKGLASATADTSKQLKNALGDLKENLGRIFETALAPMRKFFTEVISNLNDVLKKSADVKKAMKDVFSEENINIEAPTDSLQIALDEVLKKQREVTANYSQYIQLYGKYIDQTTDETVKAYKEQISDLNRQIKTLSEELIKRRKESDSQAKARKEAEANAEEEKQINDLKEKYLKLIAEQEAKWANIKKVTGEAVKNEERLKFYQEQLVAIMTESGGKITTNNQYYKDQMAIIEGLKEVKEAEVESTQEALEDSEDDVNAYSKNISKAFGKLTEQIKEDALDWSDTIGNVYSTLSQTFGDVFTQVGESLVEGGKGFKQYAGMAVKALAQVLKGLGEQLLAIGAVNLATKQYASASIALAGAAAAFTASGVLSAVANSMTETSDETKEASNQIERVGNVAITSSYSLEEFVNKLKEIKGLFTGTSVSIMQTYRGLSTATQTAVGEYQKALSAFNEYAKTAEIMVATREALRKSMGEKPLLFGILPNLSEEEKQKAIEDRINKLLDENVLKTYDELKAKVDEMAEAYRKASLEIVNLTKNTISSYKSTIAENRTVIANYYEVLDAQRKVNELQAKWSSMSASQRQADINKYQSIVNGGVGDITSTITYQLELYRGFVESLLLEQKVNVQNLTTAVYTEVSKTGTTIGNTLVKSILSGATKTDFLSSMKDYISETLIQIAIYTESFEDKLAEIGAKLSRALLGLGDTSVQDIRNELENLWDETEAKAKRAGEIVKEVFGDIETNVMVNIKDFGTDISNTLVDSLTNGLGQSGFLDSMKNFIRKMLIQTVVYTDAMKSEIESIGRAISKGLTEGFTETTFHEIRRDLSWTFDQANRSIENIDSILNSVFGSGYATGTNNATAGLHLVGEAGPELVRFRGGEQVLNAGNTQKALSNAGGTVVNQNVTFNNLQDTTAYAMMNQFKQYNRQMAINGVI